MSDEPEEFQFVEVRVFLRHDSLRPVRESDGDEILEIMRRGFQGTEWDWVELIMSAATHENVSDVKAYYDENSVDFPSESRAMQA